MCTSAQLPHLQEVEDISLSSSPIWRDDKPLEPPALRDPPFKASLCTTSCGGVKTYFPQEIPCWPHPIALTRTVSPAHVILLCEELLDTQTLPPTSLVSPSKNDSSQCSGSSPSPGHWVRRAVYVCACVSRKELQPHGAWFALLPGTLRVSIVIPEQTA